MAYSFLSRVYTHTDQGLFRTRPDGRWLRINPALVHLYGFETSEALMFAYPNRYQMDADPARRDAFMQGMQNHAAVSRLEMPIYHRDGSIHWMSETVWPVRDKRGHLLCYEGTLVDTTLARQENEKQSLKENCDPLTQLPNRRLFLERFEEARSVAQRGHSQVAMLFLDIDHFKQINDTLGHAAGDKLLQKVAAVLKSCMRPQDTLARLGGDEFTACLPGITSVEDVVCIAQRWLDLLTCPIPLVPGQELTVTVSIGISLFPSHGHDAAMLLRHADLAMYKAKQQGRNRYQMFSVALNACEYERLILAVNLRKAIEQEQLVLFYQPQISLKTGLMTGVEALIRWQHPIFGIVPPGKFIPIAEETGLIVPLGEWAFRQACRQAATWQQARIPLKVSVNLSARQFLHKDTPRIFASILEETGVEPHQILLELTESVIINNVTESIAIMNSLKALGVGLSVDDFGTGYSSLSYLRLFPLDELKVDRSFVQTMLHDARDSAIIQAIIVLSHVLGLTVTAEGIETEAQQALLRTFGCDTMQGYLFSPPVRAEEIAALFQRAWKSTLQYETHSIPLAA